MNNGFDSVLRAAVEHGGVGLWLFLILLLFGLVLYFLHSRGLVTFGEVKDRRKSCPIDRCTTVEDIKAKVIEHKEEIEEHERVATSNMEEIKNLIYGTNDRIDQNHLDFVRIIREIAEKVDGHIGFCKGIQSAKCLK